ncbi:MAG TPA: DUF6282 family protein, partial [bacterium]|nr:DUF6282 family protein [bacterium]
KGRLLDSVRQVLEVMAGRPAALSCGHLAMPEIAALFAEAKRLKIERRVLTHADASQMHSTLDFQLEMAKQGHFIERSFLCSIHPGDPFPVARTAAEIKQIGPERVVLETDLGQASNMAPTAGLASYCQQLFEAGLSEADVRRVVGDNSAYLLSLPAQ